MTMNSKMIERFIIHEPQNEMREPQSANSKLRERAERLERQ